jgi:RNA polymerase sigma-70 factor (ECF subfamily)
MGTPGRSEDHQWSQQHLSHYVEGELGPRARRRLDRHALGAWIAGAAIRAMRAVVHAVQGLDGPAGVRAPHDDLRPGPAGRGQRLTYASAARDAVAGPISASPAPPEPRSPRHRGELIARAQAGMPAPLSALGRVRRSPVHAAAAAAGRPRRGRDVAQDVMLRAWRGIARFRASPATSPGCTGSRSTRPTAALEKRARRPASARSGGRAAAARAAAQDPSRQAENSELRRSLGQALAELPPALRTAIVLRDVEGLSTQRPRRSPASARPLSRAGCTRHGCGSGPPSATRRDRHRRMTQLGKAMCGSTARRVTRELPARDPGLHAARTIAGDRGAPGSAGPERGRRYRGAPRRRAVHPPVGRRRPGPAPA